MIIVLGALATCLLFSAVSWSMAFLLAAILVPTDAALGQSVVSNWLFPARIRQTLNVYSGLNDGIALPVVLVFAVWAGVSDCELAVFALLQVVLGSVAGAVVGTIGALAINRASDR